ASFFKPGSLGRQGGASGDLRRGQELVPRCGRKPAERSAAQSAVRYSVRVSILSAHELWRGPSKKSLPWQAARAGKDRSFESGRLEVEIPAGARPAGRTGSLWVSRR